MRKLALLMLLCVTTLDYLTNGDKLGRGALLPGKLSFLVELFGVLALLYVVFAGVRSRFQLVRPAYWIVLGALAVTIVCGVMANATEPGPVFAGLRNYLRALPWLFVPAVVYFSDEDVRSQLKLLVLICLAQVPLSIAQRVTSMGMGSAGQTGDYTTGTLQISSILSIFLICAACVLAACFVHRRLGWFRSVLLFSLLLVPTTINETKGSLVLLPIGLALTYLVAAKPGHRLKTALFSTGLLGLFVAAFVPAYDYFQQQKQFPRPIGEFFTQEGRLKEYLWKDEGLGTTENAGRADSIVVPLQYLARDPATLFFGLGLGNASRSALGDGFEGRYAALFEPFITTAFARIVLELGLIGLMLVLCLHWLIYVDAVRLARLNSGLMSTVAAGWVGVTAVMTVSLFYKDVIAHASVSFVFWYFSGLVAAQRMRLFVETGHAASRTPPVAVPARDKLHAPWRVQARPSITEIRPRFG